MMAFSEDYYIALGSNLSTTTYSSFQLLQQALISLNKHPDIKVIQCSPCYLSTPVGPQNQAHYHNAVAHLHSKLEPLDMLMLLQSIEAAFGRNRGKEQRWGARTIDLDILLNGNLIIEEEKLTLPHKELENRSFVLIPLHDLNHELILPSGKKLKTLAENCDRTGIIKRINEPLWP